MVSLVPVSYTHLDVYKRQAERVLREVGRILHTYCYDQHSEWSKYVPAAENFINLSHHQFIETTPYTAMFQRPSPREITSLIQFPNGEEYQFVDVQFHHKILEKMDKIRQKYKQMQPKPIQYQIGEQILLRNRGLPSTMEAVSYTHLDVYKRQPEPTRAEVVVKKCTACCQNAITQMISRNGFNKWKF